MNQIDLAVESRGKQTKNENRRDRRAGKLPVVIYGGEAEPQAGRIDGEAFHKLQHLVHSSTIFNLTLDGKGEPERAIIRETQYHPVTDRAMHLDFYRIQIDKQILVEVPVHGIGGTPAGVKLGGTLEAHTRRVEIRVLPLEVPESIDIDYSQLAVGHSLHVSDLTVPEGVEILTPGDAVLFTITAPKAEETAKAEGEAPAQPELVGEKKAEEAKED